MKSIAWQMVLIVCLLIIAGCAVRPGRDFIASPSAHAPANAIVGRHDIFVASTRAKAQNPAAVYSGFRSHAASYASIEVSVPRIHKTGSIELSQQREEPDPAKAFVAESLTGYAGEDDFTAALRNDITAHGGRALVFVHGFNTGFDAAVYRVTQIMHDADYTGTPILFTWASADQTLDYVYDINSATIARDALEETIKSAERAGAKRIDIVGHSLGNWVVVEALRQFAIEGQRDLGGRLGHVVLASPDIDIDVFKAQMRRYGRPEKPFAVLLSDDDRALYFSRLIAGGRPRVGDYGNAKELAELGVIVVDLTKISAGDSYNHAKFADNPQLVRIFGERLAAPQGRADGVELTRFIDKLRRGMGGSAQTAANIVITTPPGEARTSNSR